MFPKEILVKKTERSADGRVIMKLNDTFWVFLQECSQISCARLAIDDLCPLLHHCFLLIGPLFRQLCLETSLLLIASVLPLGSRELRPLRALKHNMRQVVEETTPTC